jgi:hypothetical protein
VGIDYLAECVNKSLIFRGTAGRSCWRQIRLQVAEDFWLGTDSQAQQIVISLLRKTMVARGGRESQRHNWIYFLIPQIRSPRPRSAQDQSAGLIFTEMQKNVRCKVICGVFGTSEYGYVENVEGCMPCFVESDPKKLSDSDISGRDSVRRRFGRQRL